MAGKAVRYVEADGIADTIFVGPEAEFFIFDGVSYEAGRHTAGYYVDSVEAPWNSGEMSPRPFGRP